MKSTTTTLSLQDRQRRRAARTLDIAHSQHCNGQYATLAWCAAGRPARGIHPDDVRAFQEARSLVHSNGGKVKPGDVSRLLERIGRGRR
jgi:hypothetical protein